MPQKQQKKNLIAQIESELQTQLSTLKSAALESHKSSTSEESKAEGKYDTRGLEASYLAEAQAEQVTLLEEQLGRLKLMEIPEEPDSVLLGSLVLVAGEEDELGYFILPVGAGKHIEMEEQTFTVITPESPVGQSIFGKQEGEFISHPVLSEAFISEIW